MNLVSATPNFFTGRSCLLMPSCACTTLCLWSRVQALTALVRAVFSDMLGRLLLNSPVQEVSFLFVLPLWLSFSRRSTRHSPTWLATGLLEVHLCSRLLIFFCSFPPFFFSCSGMFRRFLPLLLGFCLFYLSCLCVLLCVWASFCRRRSVPGGRARNRSAAESPGGSSGMPTVNPLPSRDSSGLLVESSY